VRYWLMKTEPNVFSIDDLKSQKTTPWEGVRNYQARNFMRDEMKKGDLILIYHSNAKPPGIAGVGVVSKEAFPDHFAWDKKSKYYDPKSTKENPRWMMVEVKFKKKFKELLSLGEIKETEGLENMLILRKGNRLSITPVEKKHFEQIIGMR